jgi:hypothetical protein
MRPRRRNNGGGSQESLLRRSTENMDTQDDNGNILSSSSTANGKEALLKTDLELADGYVHKTKSNRHHHQPKTAEDLLAQEANFDASGAHLAFYYPEEHSDEEEDDVDGKAKGIVGKPEVYLCCLECFSRSKFKNIQK